MDDEDDDPPESPDWWMRSNRRVMWLIRLVGLGYAVHIIVR